jgi:uncharacterized lipoprotein YddW (UPF0748 family)
MKIKNLLLLSFLLLAILSACSSKKHVQANKRFLRGVWIATVANIDWPTSRGLSVERQKQEMTEILDATKAHSMNTVVFQIRPTADAFYNSEYEPYSYWITGKQGENPGYDPLQFLAEECHKRGLYLHVWLNPYRINNNTKSWNLYDDNHIMNKHPEWVADYGEGKYFNPGIDQVREFTCNVVKDIVRKYDIDAIHMDDYFYPYKIGDREFPDDETFAQNPRGFDNKADWRRNNVNLIIKEINSSIKSIKPYVEFGISPFAIWRNKKEDPRGSNTKGMSNYDGLYADILLWQKEGWIDYVLPQLYFYIGYEIADYEVLADWWSDNTYGANLYVGLAPYRVDKKAKDKQWRTYRQIIKQIDRNMSDPNIKGEFFYSAKQVFRNRQVEIKKKLTGEEYKYKTISPENNRIKRIEAECPTRLYMETVDKNHVKLKWKRGKNAKRFVIYKFKKYEPVNFDNPEYILDVTGMTEIVIPCRNKDFRKYRFGITSLSPSHSESAIAYFN